MYALYQSHGPLLGVGETLMRPSTMPAIGGRTGTS